MDRGTRVATIMRIRDYLQSVNFEDAELLLMGFNIGSLEHFSIQEALLQGDDEDLLSLASFIRGEISEESLEADPSDSHAPLPEEPLKIFASHLSPNRALVGEYRAEFDRFGVDLFVAHDSIEPTQIWADEILRNLSTVHAGLVFFQNGFIQSAWCDQEVGWLLGRGIPMPTLKFDFVAPYGPLGSKQAIEVRQRNVYDVVDELMGIYRSQAQLAPHLAESLSQALLNSRSFNRTDRIWRQLSGFRELTKTQCDRLRTAADENDQVYNAYCRDDPQGRDYREVIAEFLDYQAGHGNPSPGE